MIELIGTLVHNASTYTFHLLVIPVAIFSAFFYFFCFVGLVQRHKTKKFIIRKLPYVTIQIPTFNELVAIRCAEKCLKMNYPKNKFEILVGDDSNKKEVSNMIDAFAAK